MVRRALVPYIASLRRGTQSQGSGGIREGRKNLSQEELAFRSGISRTYPSLLERARRQPSLTVLLAVAEGLEVRPDFLLNRTIEELKG
jgi:transcriptional regulator with XRE-family HTH domain